MIYKPVEYNLFLIDLITSNIKLMINYVCHKSVLLNEAIDALNINPSGIYIDGTFGLGGHSKLILSRLNKNGRLISIDRDWSFVKIGKLIAKTDKRLIMIHTSFSKIFTYIQNMNMVGLIDGILLDLGLCTAQITDSSRGFSFMINGPLDMRMDISTGQSAATWLAMASQGKIEWVLKNFGQERFAKNIAKYIVLKRQFQPILYSFDLSKIISNVIYARCNQFNKRKHPATRSFLAIRIYINEELKEIMQVLQDTLKFLSPKGRLVVISFNSLEDRLIKRFIYKYSHHILSIPSKLALTEAQILSLYHNQDSYRLKNIGKLVPSIQEINQNIRARSAILRCAEKISV